jgi:translation initiation factor IF-2
MIEENTSNICDTQTEPDAEILVISEAMYPTDDSFIVKCRQTKGELKKGMRLYHDKNLVGTVDSLLDNKTNTLIHVVMGKAREYLNIRDCKGGIKTKSLQAYNVA